MSSRAREIEHRAASACTFLPSSAVITSDSWRRKNHDDSDEDLTSLITHENLVAVDNEQGMDGNSDGTSARQWIKCVALTEGTTIRVAPMERSRGGWDAEHFHEHLKLPDGSNPGRGIVVMFEAIGRECIALALSPYHVYELGKTYVVHFGANGNLQTVIRRHINLNEAVEVSFPCRVCAENKWVPYWVVLQKGKLSAGVGKSPGKNCIGTLDDSMYNMLRSGIDAVKYVGIGNSALQRNARDLRVRNMLVMSIPEHFGLDGIPMEESKFINILEMGYRNTDVQPIEVGSVPTDAELLVEYEKEREKARARAAKFCIEYKEPDPDAFLKWSEAKRLRANPEKGFITGIDTFSLTEKAKADARKERFAKENRKRKDLYLDGDLPEGLIEDDCEQEMEEEDCADDAAEWEEAKKDPLPIEQAWDNWELVEQFRLDPPISMFKRKVEGDSTLFGALQNDDCQENESMEKPSREEEEFITRRDVVQPTKIHIFSIDWACFKQIRTDDLMSYFRDYGPSYVEWLGELSCNVLFEDKYSAARAFHALSQDLPSPPPKALMITRNDDGNEIKGEVKGEIGDESDGADVAVHVGELDSSKSASSCIAVTSFDKDNAMIVKGRKSLPDYGGMGWRFCKWTVRKISNDYFGRKGTRARLLMRLATSLDVLDNRPTEWPKPPPGFSTKRKLMPWYDFSGNNRVGKKHSKNGRRDNKKKSRNQYQTTMGETTDLEHPMLSKELKSRRDGFSMEEIEAQRNVKRAEILMQKS